MVAKKLPQAIFGSTDRPLDIAGSKIPCYVLADGRRVLVGRGLAKAIGIRSTSGSRMSEFLSRSSLKPFIDNELSLVLNNPIMFLTNISKESLGYEAKILADICYAVIDAKEAGVLTPRQDGIYRQCQALVRSFAKVGIDALVDEVTGYQEVRDRLALQKILDKYLIDEWAKWTKTFPNQYYIELFRLKGLSYPPPPNGKKPQYVGHWTNDIIYSRLAPGVLKALKEKTPRKESGSRIRKFHQHLTRDYGHPALKELLSNVIFLMKSCTSWDDFKRRINRVQPKHGDTITLNLEEENY